MKRVNSFSKIVHTLAASGMSFPCSEADFCSFLKCEAQRDAPVTLQRAGGVLAASSKGIVNPKQADPFTVEQLRVFHEVLTLCHVEISSSVHKAARALRLQLCSYL